MNVIIFSCGLLQKKLEVAEELEGVAGLGPRLLQISRSTPYVTAALIGHKQVRDLPVHERAVHFM